MDLQDETFLRKGKQCEKINILSLLVGFNDADPVISKLKVHFGYVRFRHVARHAILARDPNAASQLRESLTFSVLDLLKQV